MIRMSRPYDAGPHISGREKTRAGAARGGLEKKMSCRLETQEGKFSITIEEEQGRSFLVTRRMGPSGEALISALTPEQVVRMVLNQERRSREPKAGPGTGGTRDAEGKNARGPGGEETGRRK